MKKILLTSLVALAAVSTAYAGGSASMAAPAADAGHWYVGAGMNYAASSSYDDGSSSGTYDGSDMGWSAFAGRQVNDWLAFETGYTNIGNADFEGQSIQEDAWSFDMQGVFSHDLVTVGMIQLSGLLTTGVSYLSTTEGDDDSASYTGTLWTYGAGIAMQFDKLQNVTLRADWRRYSMGQGWQNLAYAPDMASLKLVYNFS